ncbi:MAG TPA: hypothetical protein VHC20_01215 [Candidatus Paceibacterota bacterium]|nr:hypothetical protein [Candidatus Paceibacterota bacterium]
MRVASVRWGVDLYVVMKWLGRRDIKQTMRYAKLARSRSPGRSPRWRAARQRAAGAPAAAAWNAAHVQDLHGTPELHARNESIRSRHTGNA